MNKIMDKLNVGIAGAAGYTGGELIRLLLQHPHVSLSVLHSKSNAGKRVDAVHRDLVGDTELCFSQDSFSGLDVLFLCLAHGETTSFLSNHRMDSDTLIIDLSHDHRYSSGWVYGLPELNKTDLTQTKRIANPGCFATAIQLALLPVISSQLLKSDVHVNATTGSTGAGQSLSATSHFSWRMNNLSIYKIFGHQHLAEIGKSISAKMPSFEHDVFFVPQRGGFTRGIHAVVYLDTDLSEDAAVELFQSYYEPHPFVHVSAEDIDLKQVLNTNKCLLCVRKLNGKLIITSVIDNLLKGASGQAVQNMNIACGFAEKTGLYLKPLAY